MNSHWLPEIPQCVSNVICALAGIIATVVVIARPSQGPNLDAFPSAGPSGFLDFWRRIYKFLIHGADTVADIIQERYEKHKFTPFKISVLYGWLVIVQSREHIEELSRAASDEFSFAEGSNDLFGLRFLQRDIHERPYHVATIRSQLTRNVATMYPEIRDEIVTAFDDVLDLSGNEWKSVQLLNTLRNIVCRTSNRIFIGLSICRNQDWIDLNVQYAVSIDKAMRVLGLFPKFLRPFAAGFFTSVHRAPKLSQKYIGPMIEERLKHMKEYGKVWEGQPNDLLSWLMGEADSRKLTVESLAIRVVVVNFAAIHTTARSVTYALFYLAAYPQYMQPLREEVESVIEKEGWSRAALAKMSKIDSFLKECQRIETPSSIGILRKAMKDFTFSNGTFIPKGTLVGTPSRSLQLDEKFYEDPTTFKPFRFAEMHEKDGDSVKHALVSTAPEYLPFGHGKQSCPGRFFAAIELKTILAHVVMTYDVKLDDNTPCPHAKHFGFVSTGNDTVKVLFRKRAD